LRSTIIVLTVLLAVGWLDLTLGGPRGSGQRAMAADCLPWSQARPIIAQNGLIGSEQASALAQRNYPGEVLVNVKFCREGSGYVYVVSLLRQDNNQVRRVTVDAASGRL